MNEILRKQRNEERIYQLENDNLSFYEKRKILTALLKDSNEVSFLYRKVNGDEKIYKVKYNRHYTYDKPTKNSNFIYMYEKKEGIFKHFKLNELTSFIAS